MGSHLYRTSQQKHEVTYLCTGQDSPPPSSTSFLSLFFAKVALALFVHQPSNLILYNHNDIRCSNNRWGGGVIGLSILHTSLLSNYNTILIERNQDLCDGASGRNSGILCTGVDAPSGSLERALIRDSISRVREFCIQHNVPFRECGSLVCLWPWDVNVNVDEVNDDEVEEKKFDDSIIANEDISTSRSSSNSQDRLQHVLHESHIAGDTNAKFISSQTISKLEPSVSDQCLGAIHIPGETVVDPWLFPLTMDQPAIHVKLQIIEIIISMLRVGKGRITKLLMILMKTSFVRGEKLIWNYQALIRMRGFGISLQEELLETKMMIQ